jgi:hypothetical protein
MRKIEFIKRYEEKIMYDFSDFSVMLKRIIINEDIVKDINERKKKSVGFNIENE